MSLRGSQLLRTEGQLFDLIDHQAHSLWSKVPFPWVSFLFTFRLGPLIATCATPFSLTEVAPLKVCLMCHCQLHPQAAWGWGCLLWANYYWAITIDWALKYCVTSKDSHKLPHTDDLSTNEMYSLTFWRPFGVGELFFLWCLWGQSCPCLFQPLVAVSLFFFWGSTQMMTSLKSSTFSQFLPTYLSMLKILLT